MEDPVEYNIPYDSGEHQVRRRTHVFVGIAFGSSQDPNVILIGECRDKETGKIALEAGLTGHMVLTSLHTNDAIGTIERLRKMDLDNFAIASSMVGVISQRLVRRLCPACAVSGPVSIHVHEQLAINEIYPRILRRNQTRLRILWRHRIQRSSWRLRNSDR